MKIIRPKLRQPIPPNAQKVFQGVIFSVYQWQQRQFDSSFKTFEKLKRLDSALVIPVTVDNKILIAKQSQPGKENYLSFFGGVVTDESEPILDCAARELLEETGYVAETYEFLESHQESPKLDSVRYSFIAKGCHKVDNQLLDPGEKFQISKVNFEEMCELLINGGLQREETIANIVLKAKLDPQKIAKLKKLFLD